MTQKLHDFLEYVYEHAGRRTKRAAARIYLDGLSWSQKHTDALESCKRAVFHRTTLAQCDEAKRLCTYTDAGDSHWSGVVTHVPRTHQSLTPAEQDHEPLAFHSGRLCKAQLG